MEAKRKQDDDGVHSSIAGKRPKNDLPDGSPVNPLQIDTGNTQIDEKSKLCTAINCILLLFWYIQCSLYHPLISY